MLKFKGCRHVMPTGRRCHSPALRIRPMLITPKSDFLSALQPTWHSSSCILVT